MRIMENHTFSTKEQELLFSIMETRDWESRYGHVSCFEANEVYDKIKKGHEKSRQLVAEISNDIAGISEEAIYKIYEDIAKDAVTVYGLNENQMIDGILTNVIQFKIFDLDEFLRKVVLLNKENELFLKLFYSKERNMRVEFLELNYLCNLDVYYTDSLDYLVQFEVNEDMLEQLKGNMKQNLLIS